MERSEERFGKKERGREEGKKETDLRIFSLRNRQRRSAKVYYFFIKVRKCSTSFLEPTTNVVLSCNSSGSRSRILLPSTVTAIPPACSAMRAIGATSYKSLSLPLGYLEDLVSLGYRKIPPFKRFCGSPPQENRCSAETEAYVLLR